MGLVFYNTATRRKEEFRPLHEGKVGMYVCGVTVYDLCHIGHARSAVVFDVMVRYLRARGLDVTYVRNFTDIDDKIINRARELGKDPKDIAEHYIQAFYEDMEPLGVQRADIEPKATEHIPGMIQMIQRLLDKGHAYVADGDVLFSVESFPGYGALSGRRLEDMEAGARVAVDEKKRHPLDFVLWKAAKPGEPKWESPWGPGRPGWHIECSVMSNHYLGPSFDIHGGGRDLLFPHHENERAQSVAANGGEFARFWIHNGFVTVESEKMSKSLGNFLTIRDALKEFHPEVLRLFLLSKHYRSPVDFSRDAVLSLQAGLIRIYRTLERIEEAIGPIHPETLDADLSGQDLSPFFERFTEVMDDDLNTAGAVGILFDKVRDLNRLLASHEKGDKAARALEQGRRELCSAAKVMGLLERTPSQFFSELPKKEIEIDPQEVERLISERAQARARKDWTTADAIRDRLKSMGIVLEDTPKGTIWRIDVQA